MVFHLWKILNWKNEFFIWRSQFFTLSILTRIRYGAYFNFRSFCYKFCFVQAFKFFICLKISPMLIILCFYCNLLSVLAFSFLFKKFIDVAAVIYFSWVAVLIWILETFLFVKFVFVVDFLGLIKCQVNGKWLEHWQLYVCFKSCLFLI